MRNFPSSINNLIDKQRLTNESSLSSSKNARNLVYIDLLENQESPKPRILGQS